MPQDIHGVFARLLKINKILLSHHLITNYKTPHGTNNQTVDHFTSQKPSYQRKLQPFTALKLQWCGTICKNHANRFGAVWGIRTLCYRDENFIEVLSFIPSYKSRCQKIGSLRRPDSLLKKRWIFNSLLIKNVADVGNAEKKHAQTSRLLERRSENEKDTKHRNQSRMVKVQHRKSTPQQVIPHVFRLQV